MPPRLNKRQQRELEELQVLQSTKSEDLSEEEEQVVAGPSGAGFSALFAAEDAHTESEEEDNKPSKSKKAKKKKKKPAQAETPLLDAVGHVQKETPKTTQTNTPVPAKNEKKAAKKARAKEKKAANDELDQALAELSVQYPASQRITQSTSGGQTLADLLSVSLQHLDADAEMRRFFGSKVVQATKTGESSKAKRAPTVRSHLTRPQPTWWAAKGREGLALRAYTEEEVAAKLVRNSWSPIQEKWWTVDYSKKYKSMTRAFMSAVMSGDPQGLFDLLGALPWHADTLLQISEVYRHREEHVQAVDFIDRALFTYERCFMGAFTFTSGLNRLDFDRVENRPFFLALHRQIADLQRRGCVRTSFEFARLMYALDPWNDPHGAIFHLEFLAIKAGMHQWLLDLFEIFSERSSSSPDKPDGRLNPSLLPGWVYSRALALKIMEDSTKEKDHSKSERALREAARDFPFIVPLLADKLDVSLPANLRAHRDFKIETDGYSLSPTTGILHLLSHLYVQRSFPVWKDHSSWFSSTISQEFSTLPSSLPVTVRRKAFLSLYENPNLRGSAYRHVYVLETSYRRLFSFIPRQILEAKMLACDPLPPATSVNSYDAEFFRGVDDLYTQARRGRRQQAVDQRFLEQLLPDPVFRRHLQQFFDAHPHFAQRFPGGLVQFAQMAAQMQPDLLEDLMLVEAMNAPEGGGRGGMPGGLDDSDEEEEPEADNANMVEVIFNPPPQDVQPAAGPHVRDNNHEEDEDDDDGSEEEEEDVSPMPRVLRNIIGRFFGQSAHADEESSSDEEVTLDDTGVD